MKLPRSTFTFDTTRPLRSFTFNRAEYLTDSMILMPSVYIKHALKLSDEITDMPAGATFIEELKNAPMLDVKKTQLAYVAGKTIATIGKTSDGLVFCKQNLFDALASFGTVKYIPTKNFFISESQGHFMICANFRMNEDDATIKSWLAI